MKLLLARHVAELAANGRAFMNDENDDFVPVVKLFTPDAAATWLLALSYPDDPDVFYGLCDLGLGFPELGTVRLSELARFTRRGGLSVKRDWSFEPQGRRLSDYAREAAQWRMIMA